MDSTPHSLNKKKKINDNILALQADKLRYGKEKLQEHLWFSCSADHLSVYKLQNESPVRSNEPGYFLITTEKAIYHGTQT
jgi:hypothetical protein